MPGGGRGGRYPHELRERAVRMGFEHQRVKLGING